MNHPITIERRKSLTRKQRVEAYDKYGGTCCVCLDPIAPGEPFIDEHIIPLALGGSNAEDNRGIAHIPCAKIKTRRDQNMIAKAIRVRAKHLGIKKRGGRKIQSRGFERRHD
jgi:5-methylcytosine-specific restriction protein A